MWIDGKLAVKQWTSECFSRLRNREFEHRKILGEKWTRKKRLRGRDFRANSQTREPISGNSPVRCGKYKRARVCASSLDDFQKRLETWGGPRSSKMDKRRLWNPKAAPRHEVSRLRRSRFLPEFDKFLLPQEVMTRLIMMWNSSWTLRRERRQKSATQCRSRDRICFIGRT